MELLLFLTLVTLGIRTIRVSELAKRIQQIKTDSGSKVLTLLCLLFYFKYDLAYKAVPFLINKGKKKKQTKFTILSQNGDKYRCDPD